MEAEPTFTPLAAANPPRWRLWLLTYWPLLALGVLAAVFLFWRLGEGTLLDWDEAIYAQMSREMVQSGDWLTPHWGFRPRLHKPPLTYWATAVVFQLFGVNELTARTVSALSGVAVLAVVYLLAQQLYGRRTAILTAVILLTSLQFGWSARFGTSDVTLTLFLYLAIYGYVRLRQGDERWWLWIGAACGLAFMTKSAASLVAPAAIGLSLLLDGKIRATLRSRPFWLALGLAAAIVLPWHLLMYLKHPDVFLADYLGRNFVDRATTTLAGHSGGRAFYLEALQDNFYPWFYLAPFALAWVLRELVYKRDRRLQVVLVLMVVVFGLFTIAQTKLPWYIVPLYPGLALLLAHFVDEVWEREDWLAWSGLVLAALVTALFAPAVIVLLFALAAGLLIGWLYWQGGNVYRPAAGLLCAFLLLAAVARLRPLYQRADEPLAVLAQQATAPAGTDSRPPLLLVYGQIDEPTVQYYSNRPVQRSETRGKLATYLDEGQSQEIILARTDMERLAAEFEIEPLAELDGFVYATIRE